MRPRRSSFTFRFARRTNGDRVPWRSATLLDRQCASRCARQWKPPRFSEIPEANQIGIQSTSGGALQISSLDGTTKINGSTSPFTANGVTGSVFIFLGQGNDLIQVGGRLRLTTNHSTEPA